MKIQKLNSRNRHSGPKTIPLEPPSTAPINGPPAVPASSTLRLDIGCGPNKRVGFFGVDAIAFPGVDLVTNICNPIHKQLPRGFENLYDFVEPKVIGYDKWPWSDASVDEIHSSHFIEHLKPRERCHFFNEMYRVLKPGVRDGAGKPVQGFATIVTPHWSSCRAYGDPTHEWPPVSEFAEYYPRRDWRMANAPHTDASNIEWGFNCNFEIMWGYSLHNDIAVRNQEYQQTAMQFWKEACQDMIATVIKI